MRACLRLDYAAGADVPLAALFEAASRLALEESLVVCPTGRTRRLFPLLEVWALEEGHEFAEWHLDDPVVTGTGSRLVGNPPRRLHIEGTEEEFRLISLQLTSKVTQI